MASSLSLGAARVQKEMNKLERQLQKLSQREEKHADLASAAASRWIPRNSLCWIVISAVVTKEQLEDRWMETASSRGG